jgi:hypothetical protein
MKKEIKRRKTYDVRLTKMELVHLRDMFSILLPPAADKTLSQALAELEGRPLVESVLWRKISEVAELAGVPLEDDAPDYVVAPASTPAISVFQIASEPQGDSEEEEEEASFIRGDS